MNNLIGNKIYEKKKIFFLFALIIKANLCVYCFEEEKKNKNTVYRNFKGG